MTPQVLVTLEDLLTRLQTASILPMKFNLIEVKLLPHHQPTISSSYLERKQYRILGIKEKYLAKSC